MSPFVSKKQRKYMYANKPTLAKKWTKEYGSKIKGKKKKASEQAMKHAMRQRINE